MPILYDMHMHSSFSTDSDALMQTMVAAALDAGLSGICFTEHMDLDYPPCYFPDDPSAFAADPDAVLREVMRLRKSMCHTQDSGKDMWIGFGLEFGMQAHLSDKYHHIASHWPLDFIVASQHLVGGLDPYYPEVWEGRDVSRIIGQYYEEMLSNLKSMDEWDTLAHMDYIIRYIPKHKAAGPVSMLNNAGENEDVQLSSPCHAGQDVYDSMLYHSGIIDEILKHVIREGRCLEVNTAGCRYNPGQPNPSASILRRYKELGGELITIGSDAHAPRLIASAYDQTLSLLSSLGYESYCIFKNRKMYRLQLSDISS